MKAAPVRGGFFVLGEEILSDTVLPRVIIVEGNDQISLKVNFGRAPLFKEGCQAEYDLEVLINEWTSQTVTNLNVTPKLAGLGRAVSLSAMSDDIIDFLRGLTQTYERKEEVDGLIRHSFVIPEDDLALVAKMLDANHSFFRASKALGRASLSSTIAEFDYFISRLLKIASVQFRDKFINLGDTVTLSDLNGLNNFDELLNSRVQKKIESLISDSHYNLIEWICEKLGLSSFDAVKKSIYFKKFMEACQRRHLIMHNGGIVNERYLRKCTEAGWKIDDLPPVGDEVEISEKYLRSAAAHTYMVGFCFLHLLWNKIDGADHRKSKLNMLQTSHEFLEGNLTKLAERVVDFAEESKANMSFDLQMKFGVNRALCSLYDPRLDKEEQTKAAKGVLEKYDWSAKSPVFDLALACVRRDFSDIVGLAKLANESGLGYAEAATWVVFKEARKIDGFLEVFPKQPIQLEKHDVEPG